MVLYEAIGVLSTALIIAHNLLLTVGTSRVLGTVTSREIKYQNEIQLLTR